MKKHHRARRGLPLPALTHNRNSNDAKINVTNDLFAIRGIRYDVAKIVYEITRLSLAAGT